MPAYPGYLENFPAVYQNIGLQRMASRLGLSSLTVSNAASTAQVYSGGLYDGAGFVSPANPVNHGNWDYHAVVLQQYLDQKHFLRALEYVERFVFDLWKPTVDAQIALYDGGGGGDA